jgi:hypothetical protein
MFFDPLGASYERNLKVAQAINESGVNLSELAKKGNGSGFVGRVSDTAYSGARLVGLDETAATKEIMKLLQQYHLSLQDTDNFFIKLQKDTKSAGITSTKYLQIIDGITSQFDRMGRSIDDVTSLLRVMGHTGTMSAEGMKEAMDALTSGGQKHTLENRAYYAYRMTENPEMLEALRAGREARSGSIANRLKDAMRKLQMSDKDIESFGDLTNSENLVKAQARFGQWQLASGKDADANTQNVGDLFREAMESATRLQGINNLKQNPGSFVQYAASQDLHPEDATEKVNYTLGALIDTFKQLNINWADYMKNPAAVMNGDKALGINKLLARAEVPQDTLDKIHQMLMNAGVSTVHDVARYELRDALDLDAVPAESADAVVCNFLVEHLERPEKLFAVIHHLLKPAGTAFVTGGTTPRPNGSCRVCSGPSFGESTRLPWAIGPSTPRLAMSIVSGTSRSASRS